MRSGQVKMLQMIQLASGQADQLSFAFLLQYKKGDFSKLYAYKFTLSSEDQGINWRYEPVMAEPLKLKENYELKVGNLVPQVQCMSKVSKSQFNLYDSFHQSPI